MVIWTFAPKFNGAVVRTKQLLTLRLLVWAEICRSDTTSVITIAAANGLRNSPVRRRATFTGGPTHNR